MAEQGQGFTPGSAARIASSVRKTETTANRAMPGSQYGVAPFASRQVAIGKANGAIPKVTDGVGTGKVDLWHYASGMTSFYDTGEDLTQVNAWGLPDGYQIPDGAEVVCVYVVGPNYACWFAFTSWPCFEPIPSGS